MPTAVSGITRTTPDEVAEAQRLGGLRRTRARTVAAAYDVAGLDDIPSVRRVLEIVLDTLGLENSVARSRVLVELLRLR
jgi:hypothetical protein